MEYRFGQVGLLVLVVSMSVGGCASRSWYEGMQLSAENECQKQPPGAREDCLLRLNKKSHDAYEKERAAIQ
ncbi:MAG: hypothetical protein ACOYNF_14315 [Rhodoferax sp.]